MVGAQAQNKRSFLIIPELSQLGLVIRRPILDSLQLLQQDEPGSFSSSDISTMFNSSPLSQLLLLVRDSIDHCPLILVCSLPSLTAQLEPPMKKLIKRSPLWIEGVDSDCIVQLSPTHRVLRGSSEIAQVKSCAVSLDDLSIVLGGTSLWFVKGLKTGVMTSGIDTFSFTTELLEIWGR